MVVLGAAGGVGLAAVDLAVAMKARVLAAASSPEKLELCRQRGAEATVDYDREDLKIRIRELTGDAARVVLDPVGGPYAEPALRGLARGGTFVTLGYAAGAIPSIPLNLVLLKGITVRGMEIRTFVSDRPDDSARDMRELTRDVRRRHDPAVHRRPISAGRNRRGAAARGRPQGDRQGGHRRHVSDKSMPSHAICPTAGQASRCLTSRATARSVYGVTDVERRIGPVEHTEELLQRRLVAGDLEAR